MIADRAIAQIVREAVPRLADFCLVHLITGRTLTCVAGAHSTSAGTRDMKALMRAHRIPLNDRHSTVAGVVRTRRATLRRTIYQEDEAEHGGVVADLHRKLAPTSALVVPILSDKFVLGALSLCYSHSGRSYAERHLSAARRLALRIADAILPPTFDAASRVRAAARHPRQGTTVRRRVAARN